MGQIFGDSGGTPAGTNTQIQFNDAGAFGGSANFTFDSATNVLTLGGRQVITQGTITADAQALSLTTTWNNAGVTFTGIRYNVTDTASNAASLLFDLQVGGSSLFRISKGGSVGIGAGSFLSIVPVAGGNLDIQCNGSATARFLVGSFGNRSDGTISWSSTTSPSGTQDVIIGRDGAGILAQRNLANQQTFRIYNTTDAGVTNFERLSIGWSGTTCTIATEQGGTGLGRVLNIQASSSIQFRTNGANTRWTIPNTGHLTCFTDNAFDIGASGANRPRNIFIAGGITHGSTTLLTTTVALTDGAGVGAGTLTNAPAAGNPTKWIPIDDNGTTRHIPAW